MEVYNNLCRLSDRRVIYARRKMLAQVENLINKKLIIVSGVATILCGMFNMFIFVDYFANNANGNMY